MTPARSAAILKRHQQNEHHQDGQHSQQDGEAVHERDVGTKEASLRDPAASL